MIDDPYPRPGVHSRNRRRVVEGALPLRPPAVRFVRALLLTAGLCCLGFYIYSAADEYVYQKYENWAFDRQIAGSVNVSFLDFVRAQAGIARFATKERPISTAVPRPKTSEFRRPSPGEALGRVAIGRLHVSAMVREGVDKNVLSTAVGHVPTTSLPGQLGNFAIAAHRDTLFRALKDIRLDDTVTIETASGTYTYKVLATKIVKPSDVSVLRSDGGGLIPGKGETNSRLLTMITCYPFYYVGSAPKRFIVQGELISPAPHG